MGDRRLTAAIERLTAALYQPLRPLKDANGKLVGAQRDRSATQTEKVTMGKPSYSLTKLLATLGKECGRRIKEVVDPVILRVNTHQMRLENIEARLAELESHKLEYVGVHEPGKSYAQGQFVTHGGSLWFCKELTYDTPGHGNSWQLAVKRGRDGRDAK